MKYQCKLALSSTLVFAIAACNSSNSDEVTPDSTSNASGGSSADTLMTISLATFNPESGGGLKQVIEVFEARTGHTVNMRGYNDGSEAGEEAAIRAGNAPDLLVFPQPGVVMDLVSDGFMKPLRPESYGVLTDSMWSPYLTQEQLLYGGFYLIDNKQSIWYSRALFDQEGIQPPTTRSEFAALITQLDSNPAADHVFCQSIMSGWAATDLIERAMLAGNDASKYQQWVRNDIRFNDPEFLNALAATKEFLFDVANPDFADRSIFDAAQGLLPDGDGKRECFMHMQAGWITYAFGGSLAASDVDGDIDFFIQPYASDTPVALVGGALISKGTDNLAADEFIEFLFSSEGMALVAETEYPAYHQDEDAVSSAIDTLPNAYLRKRLWSAIADAAIATGGDGVVFDASDSFPSAIAQILGNEIISFAKGEQTAEETGDKLQSAWDSQ